MNLLVDPELNLLLLFFALAYFLTTIYTSLLPIYRFDSSEEQGSFTESICSMTDSFYIFMGIINKTSVSPGSELKEIWPFNFYMRVFEQERPIPIPLS